MNDNEVNLLNEIKKQIERFDGKASILSAIAGALLGLSFGWIPIFKNIENCNITIKTCFLFTFVLLYVVFLCLAFLFFILTIFPRSTPKKLNKIRKNDYTLYYKDLQKMKPDSIKEIILQDQETDLLKWIQINSIIACKKHKMLVLGILFLILSTLSIVISLLFYMFI
ncbi:Pycsar system effector family protein [Spiroplasma endosymbiont of Tiphia femorata]|uniref:Pycsar system effector family protein n=1 Tax=Spiroplasma endosymbiont of Tiphia femorata TaxID=3066326 RepID=UPI0030D5851E